MAVHSLSSNFSHFFNRINPSPSFVSRASSQHTTIKALIENPNGLASELQPVCFLQGSYKRQTAIYTINDVDIVVLCRYLSYPPSKNQNGGGGGRWARDKIFKTIAAPLLSDGRYRDKVRYNAESMCIKVDLEIKVEILPVVFAQGNTDSQSEPFYLFRPDSRRWEQGYARYHQTYLSLKNNAENASGNYIPAVKVFKHIVKMFNIETVSFHIECLLFVIPNEHYCGEPAAYISKLLNFIAKYTAEDWYGVKIKTPCGDRYLFHESEWTWANWNVFHEFIVILAQYSKLAEEAIERNLAITCWKEILGDDFFPRQVS